MTDALGSYVAALELRIEKLERRLEYARSRKASVAQYESEPPPTQQPDRKDSLATIRAAIHRKAERTRETTDVNSLMSDFGFLCVHLRRLVKTLANLFQGLLMRQQETLSPR